MLQRQQHHKTIISPQVNYQRYAELTLFLVIFLLKSHWEAQRMVSWHGRLGDEVGLDKPSVSVRCKGFLLKANKYRLLRNVLFHVASQSAVCNIRDCGSSFVIRRLV
jgi:hypothetical protein